MGRKFHINFLILLFILSVIMPMSHVNAASSWWDEQWSFRQELSISIDTSDPYTHNFPIDLHIKFENRCWGEDVTNHSIRVVLQNNGFHQELESQIYYPEFSGTENIKACNIVFLIPECANGQETYFVYYHDSSIIAASYEDHLKIGESYFFYEPISGFPFESKYYKILQDNEIVYAVAYEGDFMGSGTTHQVTKMKPNIQRVVPKNGELFASFDFTYFYGQKMDAFSSTMDRFISKNIQVDGNLMVEFIVKSSSKEEDICTTAIYTYYYCPTDHKRMFIHVKHEAVESLLVAKDTNVDGTYASLQVGGVQSTVLEELNFGEITPYLHIYDEMETIKQYPLDPDPEFVIDDWDIRILSTEDDIDLGSHAWASFDEGKTGVAHALILDKTNVISHGEGEEQGIQVKAHEQDYPHLPGLESDMALYQFGRNSYEKGGKQDLEIPKGFTVEFNSIFYTTYTGGYPLVDLEAKTFHALQSIRPSRSQNASIQITPKQTYNLTTYIHGAPVIPFGSILSTFFGRNFPYITAELYKRETLIASGTLSRFQFNLPSNTEDKNLVDKIKGLTQIIDWKNLSLFKKIQFKNLHPDTYVVKIIKENPVFRKSNRYLGVQIVNITHDTEIHIRPYLESKLIVNIFDQENKPVPDAKLYLLKQGQPITTALTDIKGNAQLTAPRSFKDPYELRIDCHGITIYSSPITLTRSGKIIPITYQIKINRYTVKFNIKDNWDLSPAVDTQPTLIVKNNGQIIKIPAITYNSNEYYLYNLTPSQYILRLQYSSIVNDIPITIPLNETTFRFSAEFPVHLNIYDAYGNRIDNVDIEFKRQNKQKILKHNSINTSTQLPPAEYGVEVIKHGLIISKREISVLGEQKFDLICKLTPWYVYFGITVGIISLIAGIYFICKKRVPNFTFSISLFLIIIALISPWWQLSGSTNMTNTLTKFVFIPSGLVTITETPSVIAGELASLPDFLDFIFLIIIILTIIASIFLLVNSLNKNLMRKRYLFLSISSFLLFLSTLSIFIFIMYELSTITVGSLYGNEILNINITGGTITKAIKCSWGLSVGFYLYVLATVILGITIWYQVRRMNLFAGKKNIQKKPPALD